MTVLCVCGRVTGGCFVGVPLAPHMIGGMTRFKIGYFGCDTSESGGGCSGTHVSALYNEGQNSSDESGQIGNRGFSTK